MMSEDDNTEAPADPAGRLDELVMLQCPCCKREWPKDCEQAICIELHGECKVCRFTPQDKGSNSGTADELLHIADVQQRREAEAP